jgi:thiamine biosynthesis lipoprotein
MGMPVTVEIIGYGQAEQAIAGTFQYFRFIDERFSTYIPDSEISQINRGLPKNKWSREMAAVLELCNRTKLETNGFFDIEHEGKLDPSGLVKGWAIQNAAENLKKLGVNNYYIDAGGDIQVCGQNSENKKWNIGIRNPFNRNEIIKAIQVSNEGVATSGTYIRGQHIYNPHLQDCHEQDSPEVLSLTVIGPNVYEADRFATAAFAMGKDGITFISSLPGFEGYMINKDKTATFTSGFERYVVHAEKT